VDEAAVTVVEILNPKRFSEVNVTCALNVPLRDDFNRNAQDVVPYKAYTSAVRRVVKD